MTIQDTLDVLHYYFTRGKTRILYGFLLARPYFFQNPVGIFFTRTKNGFYTDFYTPAVFFKKPVGIFSLNITLIPRCWEKHHHGWSKLAPGYTGGNTVGEVFLGLARLEVRHHRSIVFSSGAGHRQNMSGDYHLSRAVLL